MVIARASYGHGYRHMALARCGTIGVARSNVIWGRNLWRGSGTGTGKHRRLRVRVGGLKLQCIAVATFSSFSIRDS